MWLFGRRFESFFSPIFISSYRLRVRTLGFHPKNRSSNLLNLILDDRDMAEWLLRWTVNPWLKSRAGSSPAVSILVYKMFFFTMRHLTPLILDANTRFIPSMNIYWASFFYAHILIQPLPYKSFLSYTKTYSQKFFGFSSKIMKLDFNIWFLRKEYCYTKLKYSRTPAFDIVSGGVAALFAGFLGFLVCEKFGFELLDSGDFYMILMYLIFFIFSCRLWLRIFSLFSWSLSIRAPFYFFLFFLRQFFSVIYSFFPKLNFFSTF